MGSPKPSRERPKERPEHVTEEHNHEAGRPAWPPEAGGLRSKRGSKGSPGANESVGADLGREEHLEGTLGKGRRETLSQGAECPEQPRTWCRRTPCTMNQAAGR